MPPTSLLICHQNVDPDALFSAYAFSCLKKIDSSFKIEIVAFQSINNLSKQILKYLPIIVVGSLDIEKAEAIVLLDTNTLEQLGH